MTDTNEDQEDVEAQSDGAPTVPPTEGDWFVRKSRIDGYQVMAETDRIHLGGSKLTQKWPETLATIAMRSHSRRERAANAHVMAAARDLLNAAVLARTEGVDPAVAAAALDAAIAKATTYRPVKEPKAKRTSTDLAADQMQDAWVSNGD
jgi:hypothetical protein